MLYLDVTSSCKSPLNTGVQRVVRELHRTLAAATSVTPLVWDPGLRSYCTLSRRERSFLENPFRRGSRAGDAEPGRHANPFPFWSKLARRVVHRRNRLDLPAVLTAADTLFVPEIFQDNRVPWLAALAARNPARRVAVCHDAITWRHPELSPPAREAGFVPYLDALATFDLVVTISRETRKDLHTRWQTAGLTHLPPASVHPWPVNHAGTPRELSPDRSACSSSAAVDSSARPPSILCVGTFEPRKNHLTLLAAAETLWHRGLRFELILVGRTTAYWGGRVLAVLDRLGAAGCPVRWLRHVDDATLRRAYADCAFTVFPSLVEGFGLPILESLWYGRPCVCGTNGAIGEVSAGGGCLPTDPSDPTALADSLANLLTDPALLARLTAEARTRRFDTWESLVQSLLPLLTCPPAARSAAQME